MGNRMPIVWIQRHRLMTKAPSSESRLSSPRRLAARSALTSADASTRASLTNQAMFEACQILAKFVRCCIVVLTTISATLRQVSASNAFVLSQVDAGMLGDPILHSIDVTIPGTGITVLAGPSGAGKSTLLRLLNRLDDPLSGAIHWKGRVLSDWDPIELRRRVGMVFQRAPIFPGSVLENLQVALSDVTNDRALHVLEHVGLSGDLLDQNASTLSGGEAQRMCVARALLTEPEVLLADEPTAALDSAARRKVEDLGRLLADSGVSVVWVSHDTDQLRRLADHVVVLAGGAVRASGTLGELDGSADQIVRQSVGAS